MDVFEYSEHLRRLEACRERGSGFGEAVSILDRMWIEKEVERLKLTTFYSRNHHGIEIAGAPFMGKVRQVELTEAAAVARNVICAYLRQFISADLNAVVEIGCGTGEVIASLARDNLGSRTKFFAADISESGLKCARLLADLARADNLQTRALDIFSPQWDFLEGPTLFYTCNVFSSMAQGEVERFLKTLPPGRLCAFEPCGPQIRHLLDHDVMKTWFAVQPDPRNQHTWREIDSLIQSGHLKFERVIPDMAGRNNLYSLSLIQVTR